MAVHGSQPFISVFDSNGDPIVGAKLFVYEAGTTTNRAIYSNAGLSVSLSNPLTGANASDASGNFPRFYMQPGTYKLRAETSAGALIWQVDNIDTGLSAGSGALPIASGGTGAATAAAARAALDVPSNSELSDLADDISNLSTSVQSIINAPGGRLTLTSATPVLAADVTAATAVYYTPYVNDIVPIYDATQFTLTQFTERTLTLAAQHTASNIYDVFVINDSGTVRLVTGPAWSVATAGSGSRGTGAGTTELTRRNGLWVNANAMATARNGASTYSVGANQGTYVGSIYIDGSNGQVSCHVSIGQSRKWGVWNAYNRKVIELIGCDNTATWSYVTATIRAANNSAANCVDIFSGLPEESVLIDYSILATATLGGNQLFAPRVLIGFNSTTVGSGRIGQMGVSSDSGNAGNITPSAVIRADYTALPFIGYNRVTALENGTGSSAITWNGTSTCMLLRARWFG